jgi:kynurenine formamidase
VTLDRIAGFASLNYGLSTYSPDSEEGQNDPALSVKHPTHILDILAALAFLQKNYSMGGIDISGGYRALREGQYNWISVGHSCGATLAFQICMADAETWSSSFVRSDPFITAHPTPERIKPPIAVVGLEGIYSLPLLHENHKDEPFYDFFMASAFGSGIEKWREVSPAYAGYKRASLDGGLEVVVLGHSNEDELVEWEQAIRMRRSLEDQGWKNLDDEEEKRGDGEKTRSEESRKELMMLKLEGKHDEIWSGGKGVRTSIEAAINRLFEQ